MKKATIVIMAVSLIVVGLPALIVKGCGSIPRSVDQADRQYVIGPIVAVLVTGNGSIVELPLEEYVAGAVAAEMPASFELEALKAQAVSVRTYAVRRMRAFGGPGLESSPNADLTDQPQDGQAWLSRDALKAKWGLLGYYWNWSKVLRAVRETQGIVLTYNGTIIDALYHSTSGGATEDAKDVFGTEVPYLKSVPCEYDGHSPFYKTQVTFTVRDLSEKLNVPLKDIWDATSGKVMLEATERSATGRVKQLRIGQKVMSGKDFRTALGLNSTKFTWSNSADGSLKFEVQGYGHGVGLCQYGADGQAKLGKKYDEILKYYYTGVELTRLFLE